MAGATAGYECDVARGLRARVDDLVFGVEGERGVRSGDGAEGGGDEVCWVVDEVFVCWGVRDDVKRESGQAD